MRNLARAGFALTALAAVLLPWYGLDDHTPSGWEATAWGKVAAIAALAGLALATVEATPRARLALAGLAVAAIGYRLALPPDFGFDFDGLDVPTERRVGLPLALAAALLALAAEARRAAARRARARPRAPPVRGSGGAATARPARPAHAGS